MTWLTNCRVADVRDGSTSGLVSIEIEGGRIARIEDGGGPSNADVLDLRGMTVAPGLVSVHTHLSVVYPFEITDENEPASATAFRAVKRATDALQAGVTTIRCQMEVNRIDIALRKAAREGWLRAPRIRSAGRSITTTAGHAYGHGAAVADGFDGFLTAARTEYAAGADHMKVFITGGIADAGEGFDVPQMTADEMRAVVRAASEHHSYVSAHAGSSEAIRTALEIGITSYEHGYDLDEETAELMAARDDVFLTPTLCVTRLPDWMRAHSFTEEQIEVAMETGPGHLESIKRAVRAGVTLVNGTDYPPGEPCGDTVVAVRELEFLVDAGLTPAQALRSSTLEGARMLGVDGDVGTVEPGRVADLIAVDGDPMTDTGPLHDIRFVMQAGSVIRWDR
jgi:imidazolonepropionase-like amidohydrolase